MFDNLETFHVGEQVTDNSGSYLGECVSFVKRVAQEIMHIPAADTVLFVRDGLAKNMWLNPTPVELEYFDKVSTPQRGDIAVYNGSYGDVAVCLDGSRVIGQLGTPVFKPVAIRAIGSPMGYLRLKGADNMAITPTQLDKLIKGMLGRPPTAQELGNPDYLNNPGLAADTFWNNGGLQRYQDSQKPTGFVPVTETLYKKG